jgi:ubiquinone biosynthesis protein COQ4
MRSQDRPTRNVARSLHTNPAYEGHIPLNWFENAFLAVGSAAMSLADPRRGGMCPEKSIFIFN